jgi:hypothetical protein
MMTRCEPYIRARLAPKLELAMVAIEIRLVG